MKTSDALTKRNLSAREIFSLPKPSSNSQSNGFLKKPTSAPTLLVVSHPLNECNAGGKIKTSVSENGTKTALKPLLHPLWISNAIRSSASSCVLAKIFTSFSYSTFQGKAILFFQSIKKYFFVAHVFACESSSP